jgi:L-2,4-diaminobutyric acid acetyltransferase
MADHCRVPLKSHPESARRNDIQSGASPKERPATALRSMSDTTFEEKESTRSVGQDRGDDASFPTFARPTASDGAAIWRLVQADGTLEPNSAYAYLLTGAHFGATSVVARHHGKIAGFVWAYLLPDRPDTVFVWQIGVAEGSRGLGLGAAMLREILRRPECRNVTRMEATVTPSNHASMALFRGFARRQGCSVDLSTGFGSDLFPDPRHETELLVRIGPFEPRMRTGNNRKEATS